MNPHLLILLCCWFAACGASLGSVRESREASCTRDTLSNLKLAFDHYYKEYATLPTGDTPAIIAALTGNSTDAQNRLKIAFFEFRAARPRSRFWRDDAVPSDRGQHGLPIDGWGHSIILVVDAVPKQVILRSLGRNGRDDAGQPDDIV